MSWTLFALFTTLVAAGVTAGKIVVNGVCENCVTNRPIIGPDSQGYDYEQGYGKTSNNVPNGPQPGFSNYYNNAPSSFGYSPGKVASSDPTVYGNTHNNNPTNWSPYGNGVGYTNQSGSNMASLLDYVRRQAQEALKPKDFRGR
ncbi:hypothetical protein ACLKA6_012917 [Drosophila palustris]